MEYHEAFAEALRLLRKNGPVKVCTTKKMAKAMGVSVGTINNWENGRNEHMEAMTRWLAKTKTTPRQFHQLIEALIKRAEEEEDE